VSDRHLILARGLYTGQHLFEGMARSGKYDLVFFQNGLTATQTFAMKAGTLEEMDAPEAVYAARIAASRVAAGEVMPARAVFEWMSQGVADSLRRSAAQNVPQILEFVERVKALHRRRPIRAILVHHDLNVWNSTALQVGRLLGIPTLHVSHCHTFGHVKAGMPHHAGYADVVAVWSRQCLADFPPGGEYRHRLVATGTPEFDHLNALRAPEARVAARARLELGVTSRSWRMRRPTRKPSRWPPRPMPAQPGRRSATFSPVSALSAPAVP